MIRPRPTALLALVAALAATPTAARAQPAPADIKKEADEKMLSLDYQGALDLYDQVYEKTKDPALHYNRGRALAALLRFPEALDMVEAFQREANPELKAKVPKLDEFVAQIRDRVATLSVTTKGGVKATVRLGDVVIGTTPLSQKRVNAGKSQLRVQADGYDPIEQWLELRGNQTEDVVVHLVPKDKRATLVIRSSTPGAAVAIDGKDYGVVPVTAKLAPGSYQVSVDASSHYESERQIDLAIGDKRELDIPLEAVPEVYETWWFWTILGGVAAGGAIAGGVIAANTEKPLTEGTIEPGQIPVGPEASFARTFSFTVAFPF